MALVNIDSLQHRVVQTVASLTAPAGIELLSYKRDRAIVIVVQEKDRCLVRERGFVEQELHVTLAELPKLLKKMIKREFPRSRKIRLCMFDNPEQLDRRHKKLWSD